MPANRRPWNRFRAAGRSTRPPTAAPGGVQTVTPRVLFSGLSAGVDNSGFWGAASRVYPADPNPSDAAVPGGAAADVGAIRLNDTAPPDPADPLGIAARDPDAV